MAGEEKSPGGSRVYRHRDPAAPAGEVAHADDERITAHLVRTLGETGMVFHELVSERVHLDVHLVPPADDRPFVTLVTAGMSARPMNVPSDVEDRDQWMHAELCMLLPPDWPLDQPSLADARNYWPIRLLKMLARLPHEYSTWIGWGHSIPNGDPARPFVDGTLLAGALIIPPFAMPPEFFALEGEPVLHIFQVLPITAAEMDFKLAHGADGLLERLEQVFPDDLYGPLDPRRASGV